MSQPELYTGGTSTSSNPKSDLKPKSGPKIQFEELVGGTELENCLD